MNATSVPQGIRNIYIFFIEDSYFTCVCMLFLFGKNMQGQKGVEQQNISAPLSWKATSWEWQANALVYEPATSGVRSYDSQHISY